MKKTGEILREAREAKGLSLNEASLTLKIASKVLKAIEEGDEKNLPAKTFLRGFVKSYASYLQLDSEKVLNSFYEEYGTTKPQPYIRPASEPLKETSTERESTETPAAESVVTPIRQSEPSTALAKAEPYNPLNEKKNTKTIAIFLVGAVLVGLIIFTKKMIDKYSKEAEVPPPAQVEQSIEGATPVAPAPIEPINPQASPEPSPLTKLSTAVATPTPSPISSPAAATATASPAPSVTPSPANKPVVAGTPDATPTPSPSPTVKPEEKNKPVELIVEALDAVEIEYSAPNGKPQKIKLSAEQVHTFKSRSGLHINFSNGGAVNLILNGKEIGIPGDLGKPIKLSY